MSDTHLTHRKKSSGSYIIIALLVVALAGLAMSSSNRSRKKDAEVAGLQTELAQSRTDKNRVQNQLTETMSRTELL